jgi:para-aminobenzoate synthetase/4-amino-4-deoxychorismate lyase
MARRRHSVLLETTLVHRDARSLAFAYPTHTVEARSTEDVAPALELIESFRKKGSYAAGFFGYEAGCAFEPLLAGASRNLKRLLWFGIYDDPAVFSHSTNRFEQVPTWMRRLVNRNKEEEDHGEIALPELRSSISYQQYRSAVRFIQHFIRAGDTYQVNFTFPQTYRTWEKSSELYQRLRRTQPVSYSALVTTDDATLLSFAPELFFSLRGRSIRMKPMKGTIARGRTLREDSVLSQKLVDSEKDRAENLMIVDLLRNDLGRVAVPGSVTVERFFDVERYESVFQATSTIRARLRDGVRFPELIRSIFPSGSVTGAPKIRTMEIINQLERHPRGIYTGSIGYVAPNGDAEFNVAIRTIEYPKTGKTFRIGIGSGITIDSVARTEFEECLTKAKFVTERPESFSLIETMLLVGGRGIRNWRGHVSRLRDSAKYFGFTFPRLEIELELHRLSRRWKRNVARCRLELSRTGEFQIHARPWKPRADPLTVGISRVRTDSRDRLLYHKTTARLLYDRELDDALSRCLFDKLFFNERNELTEGARSNVVLALRGAMLTPAWSCGLLQGMYRTKLLRAGKIREAKLTLADLKRADKIFICNALRGLKEVHLIF